MTLLNAGTGAKIFKLSGFGRDVSFQSWKAMGGCGLPNNTNAFSTLPPMSHWKNQEITLGNIEDACPYTGRALARFAVEHLSMACMAGPYDSQKVSQ